MNDKINDLIAENEKILWQGTPDKVCYTWCDVIPMIPFALIWLIFDLGFIVAFFSSGQVGEMLFFIIPFFALHLLPVWSVLGKYIKNKLEYPNVVYAITDKRIIFRDGIIGIDLKSVDYAEIDNINVSVNVLEKIKKVGTITCTVDTINYKITSVPNPYDLFKKIQKISFDVKTDIEYPNAKRPDNNPGYNTKYDNKEM